MRMMQHMFPRYSWWELIERIKRKKWFLGSKEFNSCMSTAAKWPLSLASLEQMLAKTNKQKN